MRPIYCNTFNVTFNKSRSQAVICFAQIYTAHNYSMKSGVLTDVSGKVAEEVACILLDHDGILAIAQMMNKAISDWGIDLDDYEDRSLGLAL